MAFWADSPFVTKYAARMTPVRPRPAYVVSTNTVRDGPCRHQSPLIEISQHFQAEACASDAGCRVSNDVRLTTIDRATVYLPRGVLVHGRIVEVPSGLPVAIVVSGLALFLLWRYRENFAGLVRPPQAARSEKSISTAQAQPAVAGNR